MLTNQQKDTVVAGINAGVSEVLNGKTLKSSSFEETAAKTRIAVTVETALGDVSSEATFRKEIVEAAAAGGRAEGILIADTLRAHLHREILKRATA